MSQDPVRILATGVELQSAARHTPGLDGDTLQKELDESLALVKEDPGIELATCWLYLEDDAPAKRLAEVLRSSKPFDGMLIGWGVRGIPEHSVLFEECIEVARTYAPPCTKFLFSTTIADHLETIRRSFRK
jgi:hypothetical protein